MDRTKDIPCNEEAKFSTDSLFPFRPVLGSLALGDGLWVIFIINFFYYVGDVVGEGGVPLERRSIKGFSVGGVDGEVGEVFLVGGYGREYGGGGLGAFGLRSLRLTKRPLPWS